MYLHKAMYTNSFDKRIELPEINQCTIYENSMIGKLFSGYLGNAQL